MEKHEEVSKFYFFKSFFESGEILLDPERLAFYDYILRYAFNWELPIENKGSAVALFTAIRSVIDRSIKRQITSRENGKKGGAPIGNQNARKYPREETTTGLNSKLTEKEKDKEKEMENGETDRNNLKENDGRYGGPNIDLNRLY